MDIYIPFTYIIGWSNHKKFYYGCKYAQGCQPSDLWKSYFTSSEYVENFRQEFGEPDIIRIHRTFNDAKECVLFEHKYLTRIDAKNNESFLNKSNGGSDFFTIDEDIRKKRKETCLRRYGVEYAIQSFVVKNTRKKTMLENWGVEYTFQSPIIREKSKQTCLETYGVENVMHAPIVKEKQKQTLLEKYDVDVFFKSQIFKDKSKQTMLEKYGVDHNIKIPETVERMKNSLMEKYGVDKVSKITKICKHCGENLNINHEAKCKLNPERKIVIPDNSGGNNPNAKRVVVNGIIYSCIGEAVKATKISYYCIKQCLKKKKLVSNLPKNLGIYEIYYKDIE